MTGQPNQVVSLLGVGHTINEKKIGTNSITVNALHLKTPLGTDVIVSSATSSISCTSPLGTLGGLLTLGYSSQHTDEELPQHLAALTL